MKAIGVEKEVVILKAVKELIDSAVNCEVMDLLGNDPDSNVLFKSMTHQKFFNIVLVDLLSCTDKQGPIEQISYLGGLREIANSPCFDVNNSAEALRESVDQFRNWLEEVVRVDIWLPSIERQATLTVSRLSFIKMCGNISKHNYLRALGVAEELRSILNKCNIAIDINDSLLALSDFYERFHTDILNYHASTIAEFLNNIRWGIYEYLQPEFRRSIVYDGGTPPMYHYTYPNGVNSSFAKTCYWDLMNEIRSKPYMPKFKVNHVLKMCY
jgi:hypothetical protein